MRRVVLDRRNDERAASAVIVDMDMIRQT